MQFKCSRTDLIAHFMINYEIHEPLKTQSRLHHAQDITAYRAGIPEIGTENLTKIQQQ